MKAVIFAGGVGTRLWPISRKNAPKQFEKIVGDKSTLQLAVERLDPDFKPQDIYISTGEKYKDIVFQQLPQIPRENFIFEPEVRDVGPAVAAACAIVGKNTPNEPVAILWSDHFVKKERRFREVLGFAEELVKEKSDLLVFIGQRARFANQNLGWLEFGEEVRSIRGTKVFEFKRLIYRPTLSEAQRYFESDTFAWNPGYFVTTPSFILNSYKKFASGIFEGVMKIQAAIGESDFEKVMKREYSKLEKISFDNAILEKLSPGNVLVIAADLGWSDVGAWEALKEALQIASSENVARGKVLLNDSSDNLVFNYTDQLAVGIDLKGMIVINADDVLLICSKESAPKIKKLVESLAGTEHEKLT
ncbi:MAG: mannose-1-phosphate guanylyltransferase [Candidatus Levybacteria bacterium]|nr:mannose-1-phosphate guanylyltransferase [Candidatus Levybacteria bacterium]